MTHSAYELLKNLLYSFQGRFITTSKSTYTLSNNSIYVALSFTT